ncbi:arginine--tRNA ligase [Phytohabitans houttuyneae]|uniref:Arginine--tRNA ligase n=1 Tax=Phytohabitans houttuyneae TaxID=1076126 RepID=A0A6V8K8F5_9ACTN|nr:arginine--tRNA ligase [Phytohabitans houttuyneae]GFJ78027.1 arginine--tRNA ligase [Phytohabitans houttuyneae]
MMPTQLAEAVHGAAAAVLAERGLDQSVLPDQATVSRTKRPEHGDYASNIAMQVSKGVGVPPRELAGDIASHLANYPGVRGVEVAGPGFLNIWVAAAAAGGVVREIVRQGDAYGRTETLANDRVNLEFVSANPTGPIHVGGVRWAAVGDALARLMRAAGADVVTEYYFNDAGAQIDRFARSLMAAAKGEAVPEDGYVGDYIGEIAAAVVERRPDVLSLPEPEAQEVFRVEGCALMFDEVKASLTEFGLTFDVFFNEQTLHERGEVQAAYDLLTERGYVYPKDGAFWLRTTAFGDDKDRVIRKSNGNWGYIAADCAYYLDKRRRGFEKVILVLGADHHGYVGRLRAMVACFGEDPDRHLELIIGQLVNLTRDGKPVRLSKRAGTLVTLRDIIDAIGVDAARYALARYSVDSAIDLDLDLWTRRSNDNPVFYVQYAHARMASVLRTAAERGVSRGDDFDPSLLVHEREGDLVRALAAFPSVVGMAAELREPHRVARYLEELAGTYHKFYDTCRVLPHDDEEPTDLNRARLWLVEATGTVLANGLWLLGVSAPDRM